MRLVISGVVAACFIGTQAMAGGVDRSNQNIDFLFNSGNFIDLSFSSAAPNLRANGDIFGNIAQQSRSFDVAIKADISDKLSFGVLVDTPFGADVQYKTLGLGARLDTRAVSVLARYKLSPNLALHGGLRAVQVSGAFDPMLPAFAPVVQIGRSVDTGFVLGASYQPRADDTRATFSYFSGTQHFDSASNSTFHAPQAVNIGGQIGVAKDTLLFGKMRWAEWSNSKISVMGTDIVRFRKDTFTYSAGLGHKFNDAFAAAITLGYEAGPGGFAPALAPLNGSVSLGIGAEYTAGRTKIAAGLTHIRYGDATTSGPPAVAWTGNYTRVAALKVTHAF